MAKGQKRGNREVRKPKSAKAPASATPISLLLKGTTTPPSSGKKKA